MRIRLVSKITLSLPNLILHELKKEKFLLGFKSTCKLEIGIPYSTLYDFVREIQFWTSPSSEKTRRKSGTSSFFQEIIETRRGID